MANSLIPELPPAKPAIPQTDQLRQAAATLRSLAAFVALQPAYQLPDSKHLSAVAKFLEWADDNRSTMQRFD